MSKTPETRMAPPELPSETLYWLLKKSAEAFDQLPAQYIKQGDDYITRNFAEIMNLAELTGLGLMSLGIKKGATVGLIADVGEHWIPLSMGITGIGAVDVPRGTDATVDDLRYIFTHAGCTAIFLQNAAICHKLEKHFKEFKKLKTIIFLDAKDRVKSVKGRKVLTWKEVMDRGKKDLKSPKKAAGFHQAGMKVKPDDLATIVYTSGTTGVPKGVMLTHGNLVFDFNKTMEGIEMGPGDVTMGYLPPWHIAERLLETVCLRSGGAIGFTSVPTLAADLQKIRPTLLLSVPRVWESFYSRMMDRVKKSSKLQQFLFHTFYKTAVRYDYHCDRMKGLTYHLKPVSDFTLFLERWVSFLFKILLFIPNIAAQGAFKKVRQGLGGRVRFALSGAGALPEYIDRFFKAIGVPILEGYGMTEVSGISTRRYHERLTVGTLGKAIPGVTIRLLNEAGEEVVRPGEKGVAWHHGRNVMKGYYKNPEKTREILKNGWLNSGDLLVYTAEGEFKFAGRAKDTIVLLGGENLEPEPIEFALLQSPYVHQVVIVGQDQKSLGALIVPHEENINNWLKAAGKNPVALKDMPKADEINKLIRQEIKTRISDRNGFKAFERVTGFALLPKPFEVGDEMTSTMKVRRNVVFEKYAALIASLYD